MEKYVEEWPLTWNLLCKSFDVLTVCTRQTVKPLIMQLQSRTERYFNITLDIQSAPYRLVV